MSTERALVLGADGFLGRAVAESLMDSGYLVRSFDTKPFFDGQAESYVGNFTHQGSIREALRDVDYVVHLISATNPASSERNLLTDIDINIRGSVQLFSKCIANGKIKRIIYASSGGTVYGENEYGRPIRETDPTWPVSPYGIGKLTVENYLHYFNKRFGQDYTVFRIGNPYSGQQPKGRNQGIIPIFIRNTIEGAPITVLGDGSSVRDYIYMKDMARMITATLSRPLKHSVYNLGSGKGHSVNEVVNAIADASGSKPILAYKPSPSTFVQSSVLDMSRFFLEFPDFKLTSLRDGIRETYEYILENDYAKKK